MGRSGGAFGWGVRVGCWGGVFGWGVRVGCSGGVFGWGVQVGCSGGVFGWGVRVGCSGGMFGWGVWVGCSNRLSFVGQTNAATKASTGRTGIAFHIQTKLPTSNTRDCLGATLRASVRTEKTKSPGGWAGLSAHEKMKNRLHIAKGATCSS